MTACLGAALRAVAAFAVLGGALAWAGARWFAWDLLGESARTATVFAGGGAIAAALMASHARRRGRLFSSHAAAGSVAVVCSLFAVASGVLSIRYAYTYAQGAAVLWPQFYCLGLFVLVAVLCFVVLFNVAATTASMLPSAQSVDTAPARKRRAVAEFVAALIVLGGLGYMPPEGYHSLWYLAKAPRQSPWVEARRSLFAGVLSGLRCEVLVVPMEAPGRSLDRGARDVFTWQLAARIADRGASCVVDPGLVRRALGENRRTFNEVEVRTLADNVGASRLVRSEAAVRRDGRSAVISWRVERRAADGPWLPAERVRRDQPMDDAAPAESTLLDSLDEIVASLGWRGVLAEPDAPAARRELPAKPEDLAVDTGAPVDRAERLQLLASFAPLDSAEHRELWVRSLVALRRAEPRDPVVRALSARAWLHLDRREHAERLVSDVPQPDAMAVLAVTRGNLPQAERALTALTSPVAGLIHRVELESLRVAYETTDGFLARRDAALAAWPAYRAYLTHPLARPAWWHWESAREVSDALGVHADDVASLLHRIPLPEAWHRAAALFGPRNDPLGSVEAQYAPRWGAHATEWRSVPPDRPAVRDLQEVLFAINRAIAMHHVATRLDLQGKPAWALDEALGYAPALRQYPGVVAVATAAGVQAGSTGWTHADGFQRDGALVVAHRQFALEDAYSQVAAEFLARHGFEAPWADEPSPTDWMQARLRGSPKTRAERAAVRAVYERAVRRTQTGFRLLWRAYVLATEDGDAAGAERLLADNDHRFHGSGGRLAFERQRVAAWADAPRECAFHDQRIASGDAGWSDHYEAARCQLRLRLPAEARRRLDAWPGSPDGEAVRDANHADATATLFFRAGEFALAHRYALQATGYRTGAVAEARSAALAAMIDRDWQRARAAYLEAFRGYDDEDDLARAAWMAGLAGDVTQARQDLARVAPRQADALPGRVAVALARRAGLDQAAVREAILAWRGGAGSGGKSATWTQTWMAVEALLVDREPMPDDVEFLRRVAGADHQALVSLVRGVIALRGARIDEALRWLQPLHPPVERSSTDGPRPRGEALPLVTEALLRSGRIDEAERLAEGRREFLGADAWYYVARGLVEDARGNRPAALDWIWQAYASRASDGGAVITLPQLLLEATERLYRRTGDARYRDLLVDLAARTGRGEPAAWALGYVALHSTDPAQRRDAALQAMALDPGSARLKQVDVATLVEVRRQLAESDPFARPR